MYLSSPWRGETAASRDGNFRRVPRFIQSLNEQHSQISVTFVTFTHPERILILGDQDARILPCTMFRGPSAGPGRSVVSANNLDREVKGHRKFEKRPRSFGRVFNTLERACEIWYWLIMMNRWSIYVSIITLTWRDSCIKRWQFSTRSLYHPKFEWATLPSFRHFRPLHSSLKRFWFWDQDVRILPCTIFRGPSAVPGRSVVNANNLDRAVKRRENVEKRPGSFRRVFQKADKGYLWDMTSTIYYVSIITSTWRDSSIKRWQFSTSTLYHPKFEWATLPNFRHFRNLHSSWKDFDSGIRMQGYCLVQCSGVHQQVLADQWSVQTIWIARWKGIEKFEKRPGSFRRVFNTLERACEIWYWLIMMNRWSIMYPLSPWRGETAASRDGNFRREACIIQSSNERHSQVSVTFVPFTHPEKVLILGSGCKHDALYNVQGSISRSWQISGQCTQIWIARWKGIENLRRGRDLLEESSTLWKGHVRYDID